MINLTLERIWWMTWIFFILYPGFASASTVLNFGTYTADKPTTVIKQFRPLIKILESKLSERLTETVVIQIQVSGSYKAGIQALVNGDVDFSRVGPASYVEAKRSNAKLEILAIESNKGTNRVNGLICVAEDNDIRRVEDLKNRSFAFVNEHSTVGRYLSQQHLLNHNVTSLDLSSYEYLQRHDKVGNAVALGKFDAGSLKTSTYTSLLSKGKKLRVIATFPNVTKPWVARAGLPSNIKQAIRAALLTIKDKGALNSLKKDGFIVGTDQDYAIIRQAMELNHEFFWEE